MPGLGMEGMYNWRAGSQERSIIKGNIEIITKYVDKRGIVILIGAGKEKERQKEISLR